jgi:hypothetical protein
MGERDPLGRLNHRHRERSILKKDIILNDAVGVASAAQFQIGLNR